MTRIYNDVNLGYIDLDKIIRISKPYCVDRMSKGGWRVGFIVDVQLRNEPLRYERELSHGIESVFNDHERVLLYVDGTYDVPYNFTNSKPIEDCQAIANLQEQIDVLIKEWKLNEKG